MAARNRVRVQDKYSGWFFLCGLRPGALFLALALCVALAGIFSAARADDSDKFRKTRLQMVDSQIRDRGINDPETLRAMSTVPRHLFVPDYLRRQFWPN